MEQMELAQVLQMAIEQEMAANRMYEDLADRMQDNATREALEFLAEEELKHKEYLETYQRGGFDSGGLAPSEVVDARLVEYLGSPTCTQIQSLRMPS